MMVVATVPNQLFSLHCLESCYSKCGPQTNSLGIAGSWVDAESQALPQTCRTGIRIFTKSLGYSCPHLRLRSTGLMKPDIQFGKVTCQSKLMLNIWIAWYFTLSFMVVIEQKNKKRPNFYVGTNSTGHALCI